MNKDKVIVICSKFNEEIVGNLYLGVKKSLQENNTDLQKDLVKVSVPGTFEIPYMTNKVLNKINDIRFIITLGCVIKGETAHFEYICSASSNAIANLTLKSSVPIMFGVITSYTREQALARSQTNFNEADNCNIGYNVTKAAFETIYSESNILDN